LAFIVTINYNFAFLSITLLSDLNLVADHSEVFAVCSADPGKCR